MDMQERMLAEYGFFLDLNDLAFILKVSKTTLYWQIHHGKIDMPFVKRGKKYLFPTAEVAKVLEASVERPLQRNWS